MSFASVSTDHSPSEIHSIMASLGGEGVTQVFTLQPVDPAVNWIPPAYEGYAERALLLARPQDVVCVTEPVDGDFLEFLRAVGVGPEPDNIVVTSAPGGKGHDTWPVERLLHDPASIRRVAELIGPRQTVVLNPYMALHMELELAAHLERLLGRKVGVLGGTPEIALNAYRKHLVKAKAVELDIPVAPGEVVRLPERDGGEPPDLSPLRASIERNLGSTGRVIIRGSCGAAGSSTAIVDGSPGSFENAFARLERGERNSVYLVDVMFDALASPNVQMFIPPETGAISCVSVGDQLLDAGLVHQGNVYPSRAELLPEMMLMAGKLSEWLRDAGFSGLTGFDFVEYRDPRTGERRCFLAEMNARANGVTFPKVLMERMGAGVRAFLSINVKTTARSFSELRERFGHLLFNPHTGKGLFPYRMSRPQRRGFSAAFLGTCRAQVEAMHEEFRECAARE